MEQIADYPAEDTPQPQHMSEMNADSTSTSSSTSVDAPAAFTDEERAALQRIYDQHQYTRPWSRRASAAAPAGPMDLPIALTVLYYTAHDVCLFSHASAASAAPTRAATTASTSSQNDLARAEQPEASPRMGSSARETQAASTTAGASEGRVLAAQNLTQILEALSQQRSVTRRRAEIHQVKKVEARRCAELYTRAQTKRERDEARIRSYQDRKAAEALAQCTFTPKVSKRAAQLPSKGQEEFMEKCVEWEEEAKRRTAAKYAQYAEQDDLLAGQKSPHMSRGSRYLIEAAEKGGEGILTGGPLDTRRPLWEPTMTPKTDDAAEAELNGAHVPVTSTLEKKSLHALKQLLQRDPVEPAELCGGQEVSNISGANAETNASASTTNKTPHASVLLETSPQEKKKTVSEYLGRVEQDQARRAQHAERLRRKYAPLLLEPTTGQPFFTPNAMPTVERGDGKRVPFDQLPPEERATVAERLKRQHAAFALIKYFRQQESRRGTLVGPGEERKASIVDRTDAEQARKQRNLDRIRAEQEADCTFQPKISSSSEKMAARKTNGLKIYERPQIITQRERALMAREERPLYVPTSKAEMQKMMDRGELWLAARERRLEQARQEQLERETDGCTFTPQRITVHGGGASAERAATSHLHSSPSADTAADRDMREGSHSGNGGAYDKAHDGPLGPRRLGPTARRRSSVLSDAAFHNLSVSADVRLMNEVEMLRSRSAVNDAAFLEAVLQAYETQDSLGVSGLDRSPAAVDLSRRSDIYVTPRRPEVKTVRSRHLASSPGSALDRASPMALRQLLSNLSLRDAPRLPDEAVRTWGEASHSHHSSRYDKSADDYAAQMKSFSLSPVKQSSPSRHKAPRDVLSLSPNRADLMAALEHMDTAQGTLDAQEEEGDRFVVQHPLSRGTPSASHITASSPWPARHSDAAVVMDPSPMAGENAMAGASTHRGVSCSSGEDLEPLLMDPWAALDAQTDAILQRREQTRRGFA